MRRLTVLSVGYPLAPVGPDAVGGSEQILSALDRALVAAGHRSVVVACEGSAVRGELVSYPAPPAGRAIDAAVHEDGQRHIRERMAEVLAREPVDLVHMHGLDFHRCLPEPGPPLLATLHLPPSWYPPEALVPDRPDTWVHCVSEQQAADMPDTSRMLPPIANGVPVAALARLRPRKCTYALMLARVCPEKGLHLALDAAHAARCRLLIAGEVFAYDAHRAYFHDEVEPRLDAWRRYVGPVNFRRKRRLLAAARCLLVPSLVAETSSLVAMEAAACGTPVIAHRIGALPGIVEEGRTGFVVDWREDGVAGLAAALGRVRELDPEDCRAAARSRFSHERMAAQYLGRYAELVAGRHRTAA